MLIANASSFGFAAVFPDGVPAIAGKELGDAYYNKAGPVVEIQIARAGYRLAAWLDLIAASIRGQGLGGAGEL